MKVYQRRVVGEVVIHSVDSKMGISDGRARHVQRINNLLKIRRRAIGRDLIGENGGGFDR